jgi:hypothetical protein
VTEVFTKINVKVLSVFFVLLIASLIGVIIIQKSTDVEDSYNIKYNVINTSILHYDTVYSEKIPNYTTLIEEYVLISNDDGKIDVNITSFPLDINTVIKNTTYNLVINSNGHIIGVDSISSDMIPELTPGFPLKIVYPNESITNGYSWTVPINESIKNISASIIAYNLVGETNYKCYNIENMIIINKTIKCAVINITMNYTASIESTNTQGNINTLITYNANGTGWVNIDNGIIVKEQLDVREVYLNNLTDIYNKNGMIYGDAYIKIPYDEQISFELKEMN